MPLVRPEAIMLFLFQNEEERSEQKNKKNGQKETSSELPCTRKAHAQYAVFVFSLQEIVLDTVVTSQPGTKEGLVTELWISTWREKTHVSPYRSRPNHFLGFFHHRSKILDRLCSHSTLLRGTSTQRSARGSKAHATPKT